MIPLKVFGGAALQCSYRLTLCLLVK